jgi:hypothetical protein
MYEAPIRTRTSTRAKNVEDGSVKKRSIRIETGPKLANEWQKTVPWQRKYVPWQKNAATAAFQNSVPLLHKLKGRGPKGG